MMLMLLSIVAYANAASLEQCMVGGWTAWSECISSKHCPLEPVPLDTYSMERTSAWDNGRDRMQDIMNKKLTDRKTMMECIAEGTCPEMRRRPVPGPHPCVDGMAGDVPCLHVHQQSYLDLVQLGYDNLTPGDTNPTGNDVWGWTDPDNLDEYAIIGISGGTSFVRITDPENPFVVGFLRSATTASLWRDMKVIGNFAYVVSEAKGHGLQAFDLTHLRGVNTFTQFTPDAVNKDFGNAHNIVANADSNFVYAVGATQAAADGYPLTCGGGLFAVDVSNPLQPTTAGCFGGDGYSHDAQCVNYHGPDANYQGREICFGFNEDSLTIVDVTDKNNMVMIAKSGYINVGYTHQGWVTEDHEVILLDDEFDEYDEFGTRKLSPFTKTYVWDVRDLAFPTLKSVYVSAETSIDHNQYIIGDYVFQANYESGLRILHIDRCTYELGQVAYFDMFPTRTDIAFNGAWSVYPFFPSGNVAVSSINDGLFIATPDWSAINKLVESGNVYAEQTRTRPVLVSGLDAQCPALSQSIPCVAPILC